MSNIQLDWQSHYLKLKSFQFDMLSLALTGFEDETIQLEKSVAVDLALYASHISPFVTGSLSASHIVSEMGDYSLVHISQHTTNPWSDEDPWQYGPKVHAMGGQRAFYDRTVEERAPSAIQEQEREFIGRIEARI